MKHSLLFHSAALWVLLTVSAACNKEKGQGEDALDWHVALSETAITLSESGECQLTADYAPADKSKLVWQSSNPKAVSVSEDGLVKALMGEGAQSADYNGAERRL